MCVVDEQKKEHSGLGRIRKKKQHALGLGFFFFFFKDRYDFVYFARKEYN